MPILFASTLFVSATLLFLIQPMVAKMILPRFGGAPAVWNTCMVFYQAVLLLGYLYAHLTSTWLGVRRQAAVHVGLLLLPLLSLPIAVADHWTMPVEENPIPWVLALLVVSVGLPFFVVSSSAPLLQRWFAGTGHPSAQDPYYLYAASNLGSMLALLGYPLLIEPYSRLRTQGWVWAAGYGVLLAMTALCAGVVWRVKPAAPNPKGKGGKARAREMEHGTVPNRQTRIRWVALAFAPSSLMLGVTTYLSIDLTPFPLLWVIPLALYLLTFILVFARLPAWVHKAMCWGLPPAILLQTYLMATSFTQDLGIVIPIHLTTFFIAAMVCHGELAKARPPARYLTEFYLWMSFGGVLGGLFNGLFAPWILPAIGWYLAQGINHVIGGELNAFFQGVVEYSLTLMLVCFLMPPLRPDKHRPWSRTLDFALPVLLGLFAFDFFIRWEEPSSQPFLQWLGTQFQGSGRSGGLARTGPQVTTVRQILQWAFPIAACFAFFGRPLRFGLGVGALFLAAFLYTAYAVRYVYQERSFFGVLRVESLNDGRLAKLSHGITLHGAQWRADEPHVRLLPLLYYFPTGPIGQVFAAMDRKEATPPLAFIGLGAGTLATYAKPKQEVTFFDIDPAVVRIAQNPAYFTYLAECPAGMPRIVLGDARLSMTQEPDGHYGLIVVDAFSSDAIPMHLITQEAVQLFMDKLAPEGILAYHISNKYLNLEPVLAAIARAEGLACLVQRESDTGGNPEELKRGKLISDWVLLARQKKDFGELASDTRWRGSVVKPNVPVWTDDFSNVLSVTHWWR